MSNHKILLVEDDKLQAKTTKEYLEKAGHEIVWVENGMSAIKSAKTGSFDSMLSEADQNMYLQKQKKKGSEK
ncbi:MAG: response regulator [Thermodesulfovibrionales bacterium]